MASTLTTIIFFSAIFFNTVQMIYLHYSIQYECNDSDDRRILLSDSKSFSAIVLHSNDGPTQPNQTCRVRIVGPQALGYIVTVTKISLNSSQCEDYIRIDDKHQWCESEDSRSVTTSSDHLDVEFKTGNNTTSEFEMIVTAIHGIWNRTCPQATIRCDGGQQFCIYNGFECDGHRNCPSGSDEKDCKEILPEEEVVKHSAHTIIAVPNLSSDKPSITTRSDNKITDQRTTSSPQTSSSPTDPPIVKRKFVLHVSFTRMALVVTLVVFVVAFIGGIAVCKYRKHYRRRPMNSVLHYRPLDH